MPIFDGDFRRPLSTPTFDADADFRRRLSTLILDADFRRCFSNFEADFRRRLRFSTPISDADFRRRLSIPSFDTDADFVAVFLCSVWSPNFDSYFRRRRRRRFSTLTLIF